MKIKRFLMSNAVPILFAFLCIAGIRLSGTPIATILSDVVNRFDRNILLVLSLIIPVTCGLGMNFGIVLGAMCGQMGLVFVTLMNLTGMTAILAAALIGLVTAVICGILAGKLLNRTKGQEMITSMIVGYFSNGIYQFIFLFLIGGVIHISHKIILSGGVGIKNTIDLSHLQYSLDNLKIFGLGGKVDVFTGIIFFAVFFAACMTISALRNRKFDRNYIIRTAICAVFVVASLIMTGQERFMMAKMLIRIPIPSFLLVTFFCWLITWFMKTKLGQDMRAIGHDRDVALASGIKVDQTRIIAVVISTVLAAWGQIMFYQNLGTVDAYYGHEKVGTFCVAAILIGGASVKKANIGHAILGTILFHLLYNVSPLASQKLFNDSMVGGYFRMTICYGVIAVALMLHVWESRNSGLKEKRGEKKSGKPAKAL